MRVCGLGIVTLLVVALCGFRAATAADHKIAELKEAPAGVSAAIQAVLSSSGYRISDEKGVVCDVWLLKEIPLKPKFKATRRLNDAHQIEEVGKKLRDMMPWIKSKALVDRSRN